MNDPDDAQPTSDTVSLGVLELPKRLDRYELALELAKGGFGTVYLARVIGPGVYEKFVALKLIHPHLVSDQSFVVMFLDEARVAASISHPNVCSAIDFGEVDGVLYLAMDFLIGEPVSRLQGAFRRQEDVLSAPARHALVSRIAADAAEGLHAAHESVGVDGAPLGIVHRDVAPPNLFVRYDGGVQVMDFGVAKAAGQMHVTAKGIAKGHVAYVAPEQLLQRDLDRRADVWSLGVVLWEMLTGRRLFSRGSLERTLFAIARDTPPPPSHLDERIPPELDEVVLRALRRRREERFQTAREMSESLQAFLQDHGAPMGPGQVSAWMEKLFPKGRDAKLRVVEHAREVLGPARRDETPHRMVRRISSRPPPIPGTGAGAEDAAIPPPAAVPDKPALKATQTLPSSARRIAPGHLGLLAAAATFALVVTVLSVVAPSSTSSGAAATKGAVGTDPRVDRAATLPALIPRDASVDRGAVASRASADGGTRDGAGAPHERRLTAARPQLSGYVNVVTPGGWAEIHHGGESYGPTPARVELPAGIRKLRLAPAHGGPPEIVDVEVKAGEVVRVVDPLFADEGGDVR